MTLFSRKAKPTVHCVVIHFAQPMSPTLRHSNEDGITQRLLPQINASGQILGGGTALSSTGEPVGADIELEVTTSDIDAVVEQLVSVLEGNGLGRGSWLDVDGVRRQAGTDEYVVLRTHVGEHVEYDAEAVTIALQGALGDGRIGWHNETYQRPDGPVFVFSGNSAADIVTALRSEIPRHPMLEGAELDSGPTDATKTQGPWGW